MHVSLPVYHARRPSAGLAAVQRGADMKPPDSSRFTFNDLQLSHQSVTLSSDQAPGFFIQRYLKTMTGSRVSTSALSSRQLLVCSEKSPSPLQTGLPEPGSHTEQLSGSQRTNHQRTGEQKPPVLTWLHETTCVLAWPHTPASLRFKEPVDEDGDIIGGHQPPDY